MHHHVGDVAMDEHLARRQADDLVGRHARVGAADPQVLGRLQLGQALEELRVFVADAVGPGVVVAQQFFECLFHGISPVRWRSAFGGRASATARRSTPQGVRDRKSTRLNSSHSCADRLPSSACKKQWYSISTYSTED